MIKKLKLLIGLILVSSLALMNTGCMMLMAKVATGNVGTYATVIDSLPPIPEGSGRVFIYMVRGGPNISNGFGLNPSVSIDDRIHGLSAKFFFYEDLKVGEHKITTGKLTTGSFKKTFCYGESSLDLELSDQEVKFIKIDYEGKNVSTLAKFVTFYLTLVDSNQTAINEINDLKFLKKHGGIAKIGDTYH